ncbi:sensor histidine kinase [Streptomyces sp. NPDC090029]|uniref:sensor histidine kinase n=1 Tax=Streptomyces sp. NPDC090029 TaxID=3365924 RepID=UPI00381A977E
MSPHGTTTTRTTPGPDGVMPRTWAGLSPGVWTALAWSAGTALTLLSRTRLPGEVRPSVVPGVLIHRWDGLAALWLATAITLAGGALLGRAPRTAFALLLVAAVLGTTPLGVGEVPAAQYLAVDVALFFLAATRDRRTAALALGLALAVLAGFLGVRGLHGWHVGVSEELPVALTAVVAWLAGRSLGQARRHARELSEQATAQAVADERLRIAREVHDMVAHNMGIVALQAGAARRVIDTQPERAREALGEVERTSRRTLAGLRRMMGALREAEWEPDGRAARVEGSGPGLLEEVDRLAADTTAAGVRVEVRRLGTWSALPAEISLSAFRIVQESVTNVVRHSGARACQVTLDLRKPGTLILGIEDDGPPGGGTGTTPALPSAASTLARGRLRHHDARNAEPAGAGPSGYGLIGMRERTALLDGEFSAGPRPEGGFRVVARLPVHSEEGLR